MSDISKIKVGETTYDIKDQAGRDAFTNSKITVVDSTSDDDHIPTAKAAYDYGQVVKNEIVGAMVTTINEASDDIHYPSAKAVYDYGQTLGGSGGSSGGVGTDELVRELLGTTVTTIRGFSNGDYTNTGSLVSLSPWLQNYYRKADSYVNVSSGQGNTTLGHLIQAMKITLGSPSDLGSSYTSIEDAGLIEPTYINESGLTFYAYMSNITGSNIPLVIDLRNSITVTTDGVSTTYSSGLYFYNNIEEQKFVYSVDAYYDCGATVKSALSYLSTRTTDVENKATMLEEQTKSQSQSGYNLDDYYAVNTIHVIPEMIPEDADELNGMRRVSDYTNKDVLFHIQATIENQSHTAAGYLVNLAAGEGLPFPMYMLVDEVPVALLPEDITFSEEVQDPETGATTTEEVNLSAGIYCLPIPMIISCLEKKEKYLVQETISFNANVTPILNQFFKSSDNIDIDGLYSVLALTDLTIQGESISLSFGYASGGYFKPISYFEPGLALPTIYALEGNLQPGSIASIIVTEETVIPEEFTGVAFTVEPGTYLAMVDDMPYLELIKLQEKEMILELDQFLGKDSNELTILEALLFGLEQSETGEFNLTFNGSAQGEEKNIKKIYDILKTAYNKNGQIIISLSGEQGYITFKMRPHLIDFGSSFVATVSGSLFNNGTWIDCAFQIAVFESGIEAYSKAKAQIQLGD